MRFNLFGFSIFRLRFFSWIFEFVFRFFFGFSTDFPLGGCWGFALFGVGAWRNLGHFGRCGGVDFGIAGGYRADSGLISGGGGRILGALGDS